MTDLMRALYNFTEEQNLEKSFLDREYTKYRASAYQRFEKLTAEYPQLMRPLDDLVSDLNACCAYEQEAAAGKPRRYYHLTEDGHAALAEKEASWNEYARAVQRVLKGGICCGEA